MTTTSARARQRELEREMLTRGFERYEAQTTTLREMDRESNTIHGQQMMQTAVSKLMQEFAAATKKRTGPSGPINRLLTETGTAPESLKKLAFVLAKVTVDTLGAFPRSEQTLGSELIAACEEAEVSPAEDTSREVVKERAKRGIALTELVERADLISKQHRLRKSTMLHLSEQTQEALASSAGQYGTPRWMPCVIPPKRWEAGQRSGGYYSKKLQRRLSLAKRRGRNYLDDLSNVHMPAVFEAINAVQGTAWQINRPVFEVSRWADEMGLAVEGLLNMPWAREQHRKGKRRRAFAVAKRTSKPAEMPKLPPDPHMTTRRALGIAARFVDDAAIYFPHQMDWRGRLYAVPLDLNPQGEDAVRALLTFAQGKAITTQEAADWLMVHGANSFGIDKVSFEQRITWVREHEADILATAQNPQETTWWCEADAPWQFLAFCFEWASFKREGFGFVSQLPVSLDGTCNGLQHFSAMLRDAEGGAEVNLTPAQGPQDIYQRVADRVKVTLAADEDPMAETWRSIEVNRKLVKSAVMTLPYGAGDHTRGDQIKDYLEDQTPKIKTSQRERDYLVKRHVTPAINEIVPSAKDAMGWLQAVANAMAEREMPVQWQAPSGLAVQQRYAAQESVSVKYQDRKLKFRMPTERFAVDVKHNKLGIAANFVHSLDASHLMLTVNAARRRGLVSFAMIHDSYGTVAADVAVMAEVLREEFVRMYSERDVLAELRAMQPDDLVIEREMPAKGSLDLAAVRAARYFFA